MYSVILPIHVYILLLHRIYSMQYIEFILCNLIIAYNGLTAAPSALGCDEPLAQYINKNIEAPSL